MDAGFFRRSGSVRFLLLIFYALISSFFYNLSGSMVFDQTKKDSLELRVLNMIL